jgi:hypothetical protein
MPAHDDLSKLQTYLPFSLPATFFDCHAVGHGKLSIPGCCHFTHERMQPSCFPMPQLTEKEHCFIDQQVAFQYSSVTETHGEKHDHH